MCSSGRETAWHSLGGWQPKPNLLLVLFYSSRMKGNKTPIYSDFKGGCKARVEGTSRRPLHAPPRMRSPPWEAFTRCPSCRKGSHGSLVSQPCSCPLYAVAFLPRHTRTLRAECCFKKGPTQNSHRSNQGAGRGAGGRACHGCRCLPRLLLVPPLTPAAATALHAVVMIGSDPLKQFRRDTLPCVLQAIASHC